MCLLEGTNLSEGRGTTRPFELFGAPWFSAGDFARMLTALDLPGVAFAPIHFRPMFDKHAGSSCAGSLLRVTDPRAFRSFETGMRVVEAALRLSPAKFRWRTEPYEFDSRPAIDLLTGSSRFRTGVEAGADLASEIVRHDRGAAAFALRREPHLLYRDRRPAAIAFVGPHDAGKTTLLVDLVPALAGRGLRVGTIKHTGKDAEDDLPGKDSQRHAASGASVAAFVTPARTTARRFGGEEPLETVLAREFAECDLVLVEGYKSLPIPRIEVRRRGSAPLAVPGVSARVADEPSSDGTLTYSFGDRDAIVEAVLRLSGLERPFARI
jgi:molybdopterin-guanine dinucleotide biosynthesis protein MobB